MGRGLSNSGGPVLFRLIGHTQLQKMQSFNVSHRILYCAPAKMPPEHQDKTIPFVIDQRYLYG